jgi:RNA recognition motif-containing protein
MLVVDARRPSPADGGDGAGPLSAALTSGLEDQMAVRLYVGNLPYSASAQALTNLFSQVGVVEDVHLPTDRDSGQSRGFGFVEMASSEDAQQAISQFNGYSLDGRELRVNIAEERSARPARSRSERY